MDRLIKLALSSIVRRGSLELTTASGAKFSFGDGTGKPVEVRFATAAAQRAIMLDPELRLGEAYMDGTFIVERGTISDFLEVMLQNMGLRRAMPFAKALVFLRKVKHALFQWNIRSVARKNAKHHYDVDFRIYRLFLDPDLQYSCAYYEKNDYTLEQAQAAKKRHIAAKLLLKPGQRILDIGCGWGGMGLYLARSNEARVTGVTLSKEQLAVARARTADEGLTETVDFRLQDYRDVSERYDRIVSVGMFEHVGPKNYRTYMQVVNRCLKDDGLFLLHTIGTNTRKLAVDPWTNKYIFPGGVLPVFHQIDAAAEGLFIMEDLHNLGTHYDPTLMAWMANVDRHRAEISALGYDERFYRMWRYFLLGAAGSDRARRNQLWQIVYSKRGLDGGYTAIR